MFNPTRMSNFDKTIQHVRLLTDEQCTSIVKRIYALHNEWLHHPEFKETYTIAVPMCSYRFLSWNEYTKLNTKYNSLLREHFHDMDMFICKTIVSTI